MQVIASERPCRGVQQFRVGLRVCARRDARASVGAEFETALKPKSVSSLPPLLFISFWL